MMVVRPASASQIYALPLKHGPCHARPRAVAAERGPLGPNAFQLIRLVLAVCVLYRHSFDLLAADHADLLLDVIPPRTHLGRIALCFFMVVSGFLVTQSWLASAGWRDFLRRRALRVYPAFVVACLVSAFVAAPLGSPDPLEYVERIDPGAFLAGVVLLDKLQIPPSFLDNPYPVQVNGSLWSIRIEAECYLALMVLGLTGVLRRRRLVLGIFGLALVAHAVQPYAPPTVLDRYAHHLQLGTFFLAGAVAYLFWDRLPRSYGWLEGAALLTLLTGVLEVGFVELLPVTGTYLLLMLAFQPRPAALSARLRVDLSYGVYLYAWPVQQLAVQVFGAALNPHTLSLVALAGSAALAALSWTCVERPFLALKRRARDDASALAPRTGAMPGAPCS